MPQDNQPELHGCGTWRLSFEPQKFRQRPTTYMAVAHGLNGRMEKRLPIAIVVHLALGTQDDPVGVAELTYTENVSAHGVCVASRRAWRPGERVRVTSFKEHIELCGTVVHCRKCDAGRYAIGLTFPEQEVTWSTFRNYAGA
jgi:PilZ domain